jgi:urease accessory protein
MKILAPELDLYQDEPRQLPTGALGKDALLRLRFEARQDRSILSFMERRAPLLVQKALYCDEGMPGMPVVYIVSTSGGALQGDRYAMEFSVGPGACGHITTQASTKIHEMDANYVGQTQDITLEDRAYLEYLPESIIPFRHSRFHTFTRVRLASTASLFYAETLTGGRLYYRDGEKFLFDVFSSTVNAERLDGFKLFTEKFLLEPQRSTLSRLGVMGEFTMFGNVILLTPQEHSDAIHARVPAVWDWERKWAAGLGRLPNGAGLIYRVLATDSGLVRAKIREFLAVARPQITGFDVPSEFPWR